MMKSNFMSSCRGYWINYRRKQILLHETAQLIQGVTTLETPTAVLLECILNPLMQSEKVEFYSQEWVG